MALSPASAARASCALPRTRTCVARATARARRRCWSGTMRALLPTPQWRPPSCALPPVAPAGRATCAPRRSRHGLTWARCWCRCPSGRLRRCTGSASAMASRRSSSISGRAPATCRSTCDKRPRRSPASTRASCASPWRTPTWRRSTARTTRLSTAPALLRGGWRPSSPTSARAIPRCWRLPSARRPRPWHWQCLRQRRPSRERPPPRPRCLRW
mmetsp:Transcript_230/g.609  ORF Transcript_230/g.609 Transcript_230/m.609 type:complete len:214 (-) Transcript_230:732-1373(-)